MFGRKSKNSYDEKENELNKSETAASRIIMEQLEDDDDKARKLVDELAKGNPLILNFESLDVYGANKMLAFFVGACYALEGKTFPINEKTYLFARKVDLLDGSIKKFIDDIPR